MKRTIHNDIADCELKCNHLESMLNSQSYYFNFYMSALGNPEGYHLKVANIKIPACSPNKECLDQYNKHASDMVICFEQNSESVNELAYMYINRNKGVMTA